MSLIQKTGACIYCGQIGTVEAEEHISIEEIDKMVSLQCDCHLAKEAVKKAQRLEKAKDSAKKLFADHSEDVIYFMQAAVTLISNGEIGQIKIDTIGNVKATISKTAKNNIKIERSETKKKAVEN